MKKTAFRYGDVGIVQLLDEGHDSLSTVRAITSVVRLTPEN